MSNRKKRRAAEEQASPAGAGLSTPADELAEVGLPEEDGPEEATEEVAMADGVLKGDALPLANADVFAAQLDLQAQGVMTEAQGVMPPTLADAADVPPVAAAEAFVGILPLGVVRCRAKTTIALRGARDEAGNALSRVREGAVCHVPLGAYEKSKQYLDRL